MIGRKLKRLELTTIYSLTVYVGHAVDLIGDLFAEDDAHFESFANELLAIVYFQVCNVLNVEEMFVLLFQGSVDHFFNFHVSYLY